MWRAKCFAAGSLWENICYHTVLCPVLPNTYKNNIHSDFNIFYWKLKWEENCESVKIYYITIIAKNL